MRKPTIWLDFDGVIHSYLSGWQGATNIPDPPVNGAFDSIREYTGVFDVCIYSTRSHQNGGIKAMQDWFVRNGWPADENGMPVEIRFPTEKPPAIVGIDDRVIQFDGFFPSIETIRNFQPWNKRRRQGVIDLIEFGKGTDEDGLQDFDRVIDRLPRDGQSYVVFCNTDNEWFAVQSVVSSMKSKNMIIKEYEKRTGKTVDFAMMTTDGQK